MSKKNNSVDETENDDMDFLPDNVTQLNWLGDIKPVEAMDQLPEESRLANAPLSQILAKSKNIARFSDFCELWNPLVTLRRNFEYHVFRTKPSTHPSIPGVNLTGKLCRTEEEMCESWLSEHFGGGIFEIAVYGQKTEAKATQVALATFHGISIPGIPRITPKDAHYSEIVSLGFSPDLSGKNTADSEMEERDETALETRLDPAMAVILKTQHEAVTDSRKQAEAAQERLFSLLESQQKQQESKFEQTLRELRAEPAKSSRTEDLLLEMVKAQIGKPVHQDNTAEIERLMRVLDETRRDASQSLDNARKEHARIIDEERNRARSHLDIQKDAYENRLQTLDQELSRLRSDNRDLQGRLLTLQTEVNKAQLEAVKAQMEATHKTTAASGDISTIKAALDNLKTIKELSAEFGGGSDITKPDSWVEKALNIASDPRIGTTAGKALEFVIARMGQQQQVAAGSANAQESWKTYQRQQQQQVAAPLPAITPSFEESLQSAPAPEPEPNQNIDKLLDKIETLAMSGSTDGFYSFITQETGFTKQQMAEAVQGQTFHQVAALLGVNPSDLTLQSRDYLRKVLAELQS